MTPANSLILGLGLFFLGLRLIGENLRRLYGSSFRNVIKRTTHSPLLGAGLGTLAGAVMQSATAVTFILVSLTDSGLIKARAAAPIIVWCNVGLNCACVRDHAEYPSYRRLSRGRRGNRPRNSPNPVLANACGLASRHGPHSFRSGGNGRRCRSAKGCCMVSERDVLRARLIPVSPFSQACLSRCSCNPTPAPPCSSSPSRRMACSDLKPAMLMLYGTNLGAIGLRLFLSAGLRGERLRLVRLEDFFCVLSGALMVVLFAVEASGSSPRCRSCEFPFAFPSRQNLQEFF